MSTAENQSCGWDERVALLAGGDLEEPEWAEVEIHLEECGSCRVLAGELAGLRSGLAGLAEVEEEAVAAVRERVLKKVEPRRHWWRWAAVAATVVVAVSVGWMMRLETGVEERLALADLQGLGARQAPEVRKVERVARAVVARQGLASQKARRGPEGPPHGRGEVEMAVVAPGVVKMQTEDPDVVVYWILEGTGD
jgi:hypothetical protein